MTSKVGSPVPSAYKTTILCTDGICHVNSE